MLLRALGWPLKLVFTSAAQRHHTWLTRWLIRQMDAVIATSELSASFLKREATVVMHGVDTDSYAPPADRAAAFAEAKLPGRYAIGCFGRVRAQKGTDVFVEAMCRLLPRYPDFTAVIVGAVVPEQQGFANGLKQQIEAAGLQSRIVITGELAIEEVQRWYQRLTIYAFTSRNEGFGLTLIEAMSAGAALVAARAGAAEFVVEDGVTGVLTPPGDVDALVAALEPLMRDPASAIAMGDAGAGACAARNSASMRKRTRSRQSIAPWSEPSPQRRRHRDRRLRTGSPAGPRPAPLRYRSRSPMTKLPACRTGQCCIRSWIMPGLGLRQ